MHQKTLILGSVTALLAVALACSQSTNTPVAPGASGDPSGGAAPDGSTLKANAPTPVSPVNNAQFDTVVLTTNPATGKFDSSIVLSYEFQIRTTGGALVSGCAAVISGGAGGAVSYTPTCTLEFDTPYTWRVRAVYAGAVAPWSADATFRSPSGGYIRDSEAFDPLTNGKTVGQISGPTQFVPGVGLKLLAHESFVRYQLPVTLTAGEFSMMVLGADEGSEGDKSKVFSMQQGTDDITTNAYRWTAELRARNYGAPGSVTCRMIAGDGRSRDCDRFVKSFTSSRWYFWKVSWNVGGSFTMEVRLDSPSGAILYTNTQPLDGRTYRPNPHMLYLGQPMGRAGALDATLPNMTFKNVWASSQPRPKFPGD